MRVEGSTLCRHRRSGPPKAGELERLYDLPPLPGVHQSAEAANSLPPDASRKVLRPKLFGTRRRPAGLPGRLAHHPVVDDRGGRVRLRLGFRGTAGYRSANTETLVQLLGCFFARREGHLVRRGRAGGSRRRRFDRRFGGVGVCISVIVGSIDDHSRDRLRNRGVKSEGLRAELGPAAAGGSAQTWRRGVALTVRRRGSHLYSRRSDRAITAQNRIVVSSTSPAGGCIRLGLDLDCLYGTKGGATADDSGATRGRRRNLRLGAVIFNLSAGDVEIGTTTSEAPAEGSGHRNLVIGLNTESKLSPQLVGLVGTALLGADSGRPNVERLVHGACGSRRIVSKAGAAGLRLSLSLQLLLALCLSKHLSLELLSLLNL